MGVGIDIGSKSIKVIELGHDGKKWALKAAGAVGVGIGEIDQIQEDKRFAEISTTLRGLLKEAKVSSRDAHLSLPETQAFTRVMKFPLLSEQEINSAVRWEAEEYIPIPMEEAVLQHRILERREKTTPPGVLVLLIAARKSLVEKYVKIATGAGLNVLGVETELMSIVRSVGEAGKTQVMVDFGARGVDIGVSKAGELFFSRSVAIGGEALSRSVAQGLGVSLVQAEEYKKTYGLLSDQLEGKVREVLLPIVETVAGEIKKAIQYYGVEIGGEKPASVVLTGGCSGLPGIGAELTRLLEIEVAVSDPFSKISLDAQSKKSLASYAPIYCVSVGLAMRKSDS
jgi:type IV pilus assembly protein PilM